MNAEFTPGPWRWNDRDQLVSETAFEQTWDDINEPVKIIETDGGFYPPHGVDRPLLAAAPDLLAALEETLKAAIDWFDDAHGYEPDHLQWCINARAAIAKAKGGAA